MENEITINGTVYVQKGSLNCELAKPNEEGLKAVLIRSYAAGVHYGYLKTEEFTPSGKVVKLIHTRRVWYWDGAASLSQMALSGVTKPENCKFSVIIPENEIVNVIETIPMTDKALENLNSVSSWKM